MNMLNPLEIVEAYGESGAKKAARPVWQLLLLGILAGMTIAFGAVVSNTGVHSIGNVSQARIISGLLFPFGLGVVMLLGMELFTGNCMIVISVLERKTSLVRMFRNWFLVYSGNFIGALLVAAGCVFTRQLDYSGGYLAVYTIKAAAAKCALGFPQAIVLGIFCNVLVCAAVLCSMSAKDTTGKIIGAYIPVVFFVISGFEHSVANMYYVPAGIWALKVPKYAEAAAEAGIDVSGLTWTNFLSRNLVPVTIGNILGGAAIAVILWVCHKKRKTSSTQLPKTKTKAKV